ncbi:nucleotidyl transferase [Tessaracoccus rhinocerotis]|uniref:Nucleotidyl transferase n=1 Tax=Tessaracoccus rhinocerotis TaxID=1689449 RepID=A0A553JWR3_9ACTN|nr:DUF6036 family nucleotidyltransferase [Tessaracoccus rhinocerotis]TRY16885.1 nucleotidyl transferase [Tessaracoccus rhinocerotis]
MNGDGRDLSREDLLSLLTETGEILQAKGIEASIYVVGGAAMALEYQSRRVTRDVDAQIRAEHDGFREAAAVVADRHGLGRDWVNAAATAFMSNEPDDDAEELNLPGLRIAVASAEHLIAMKLRAMRERDMDDLETLFRHTGITEPEQAADIHNRLFDESYIGHVDPDEALYAARQVFARAAAQGRLLNSGSDNQ